MKQDLFNFESFPSQPVLNLSSTGDFLVATKPGSSTILKSWKVLPVQIVDIHQTFIFGNVQLHTSKGAAVFSLAGDGTPRWTIKTTYFAGTPKINITTQEGKTILRLKDAKFPGTDIPASFTAIIAEEIDENLNPVWMMILSFAWGGFQAKVNLADWLAGTVKAFSSMLMEGQICPLSEKGGISIEAFSEAVFYPSWLFVLSKKEGIVLSEMNTVLACSTLVLALLAKEMPKPGKNPKQVNRCSLLMLLPDGMKPFSFPLWQQPKNHGWSFSEKTPSFYTASVFAFEKSTGEVVRSLLLVGLPKSRLLFHPGADLLGDIGQKFSVELAVPMYLTVFSAAGEQVWAFVCGAIVQRLRWLHTESASMLLGRSSRKYFCLFQQGHLLAMGHPFELVKKYQGQPFKYGGLHFKLIEAAPRPGQVIVNPLPLSGASALLTFASRPQPLPPQEGEILVPPDSASAKISFPVDLAISLLRTEDLLNLGFHFKNMRLIMQGGEAMLQQQGDGPRLVVTFPTQSIGEQSFAEGENQQEPLKLPAKAYFSGKSRLAFSTKSSLPYTLATLLNWYDNPHLIGPQLTQAAGGMTESNLASLHRPELDETSIEAPFRLAISPNDKGVWWNTLSFKGNQPRYGLWHTTLKTTDGSMPTLRAIWSYDPEYIPISSQEPEIVGPDNLPNGVDYAPFTLSSLRHSDRRYIVSTSLLDEPVDVHRLMMSSLGAWLDLRKVWTKDDYLLEEWNHRSTLGRDHYVKVVTRAFLGPFGHKASVTTITERKFELRSGVPVAPLRTRKFITVKELERTFPFPVADGQICGTDAPGRRFPFKSVKILNRKTPLLDQPIAISLGQINADEAFWPKVDGHDFFFQLVATDTDGRELHFSAPLFCIRAKDSTGSVASYNQLITNVLSAIYGDKAKNVDNALQKSEVNPLWTYEFHGQKVAFAQSLTQGQSDTTLEADLITFTALLDVMDFHRPINPVVHEAQVFIPVLRQFGGRAGAESARMRYTAGYLDSGFGGNDTGQVFARFVKGVDLTFGKDNGSDKVGGILTPAMKSVGISRTLGVIAGSPADPQNIIDSDLDGLAGGTFTPGNYFGTALDAKLLGGFSLSELLASGSLAEAPPPQWQTLDSGDSLTHSLQWNTSKFSTNVTIFKNHGANLSLNVTVVQQKGGNGSTTTTSGALTGFGIEFGNVFGIEFDAVRFSAEPGKKPDTHVDVKDVGFLGALEFLNKLKDALNLGQFKDPPSVDVSPSGVIVSYSLAIPTISIGAFALQNLALNASLSLPFTGQALRARFALSERFNPFLISISLFTGGGFFAVALGPDDVELVEASLEFGGSFALDLGVASGGVYVMAGIYFKIELINSEKNVQLTGYVRAGGCLEVLGLISITIEFYLGLTYDFTKKVAWGEASVEVEVEVLFFSTSVTLSVRREFARGSKDIPFEEMMPEKEWESYWSAFAVEG